MNDIIKPFDVDLTKKLHGHVRVETRSRWTGRVVDSQEKDNLVTNAVQKMLLSSGWSTISAPMPNIWTPIYAKALGGIMLFDNTLTEQASNIDFPASTKLVGFAGQGSNTDDVRAGSYNTAESVAISNGFTTVWDFLTSQANGTISSLARTSHAFASGAAYAYLTTIDLRLGGGATGKTIYYLGYDEANKYIYLCLSSPVTEGGVSYSAATIFRVKCNLYMVDMTGNILPPLAQWEAIKTLTSSDGTTNARYFTYDKYANNFVYPTSSTTIHKIAMDGTHSSITATGTSASVGFAITENYYWRLSSSKLFKIDKSNPANIQSIDLLASDIFAGENDIVYANIGGGFVDIIYPDGTMIPKTFTTTNPANPRQMGPFYSYGQFAGSGNASSYQLFLRCNYLGTIANLDSPVTKTSSQTMKITYTLTEA